MKICTIYLYSSIRDKGVAEALALPNSPELKRLVQFANPAGKKTAGVYILDIATRKFEIIHQSRCKDIPQPVSFADVFIELVKSRNLNHQVTFRRAADVLESDEDMHHLMTFKSLDSKMIFSISNIEKTYLSIEESTARLCAEVERVNNLYRTSIEFHSDNISRFAEYRSYEQMQLMRLYDDLMEYTLKVNSTLSKKIR